MYPPGGGARAQAPMQVNPPQMADPMILPNPAQQAANPAQQLQQPGLREISEMVQSLQVGLNNSQQQRPPAQDNNLP